MALRLTGIELAERHRELLDRRTRRSGALDGAGLDALLRAAEEGEAMATQQLVCLLTTKFTGFFRNPRQFDPGAVEFVEANHAVLRPLFAGEAWPPFAKLVQDYTSADAQAQLGQALKNFPQA